MPLDPSKTLEDNYQDQLQRINEEADFFVGAWTNAAENEFSTPDNVGETVNNLSRTIFQDTRSQISDEAQKQKWR